jgi:hypothetical protein
MNRVAANLPARHSSSSEGMTMERDRLVTDQKCVSDESGSARP